MRWCLWLVMLLAMTPIGRAKDTPQSATGSAMADRMKMMQDYAKRQAEERNPESITNLTKQLRQASSDSGRENLTERLKLALQKDYDQKMVAYQQRLERLEQELEAMREHVQRRVEARDRLVELRLQMMIAEADELGWPSEEATGRNTGRQGPSVAGAGGSRGGYPGGSGGGAASGGSGSEPMVYLGGVGGSSSATGRGSGMSGGGRSGGVRSGGGVRGGGGAGRSGYGSATSGREALSQATVDMSVAVVAASQRMRKVLLAIHNYHDSTKTLPFQDQDTQALGWQVKLLPYLEEKALFEEFSPDFGWSVEANKKLIEPRPEVYGGDSDNLICWCQTSVHSFADITDGISNTLALVELPVSALPEPRVWTQAGGLTPEQIMEAFSNLPSEVSLVVGMYDGSVKLMKVSDLQRLDAILTPDAADRNPSEMLSR